MACGGIIFQKKCQFLKKFRFFITIKFSCYYCAIDLKRQKEPSGPRLDTSSLVSIFVSFSFSPTSHKHQFYGLTSFFYKVEYEDQIYLS